MQQHLDDLLQQGIDALAAGNTIDDFVARHSEQGQELRELLDLAIQTGVVLEEIQPSPRAKAATMNLVLERSMRRRSGGSIMTLAALPHLRQMAAVLAAAAILVLAPAGAFVASANALPGDSTYPIKEVWEDIQLTLAFSEEAKATAYANFALRRADELAELNRRGRSVSIEAINAISEYTTAAMSSLEKNEPSDATQQRFEELSARQQNVLLEVAAVAPETAQPALQRAIEVSRRGSQTAQERGTGTPQSNPGTGRRDDDDAAAGPADISNESDRKSAAETTDQDRLGKREEVENQQDARPSDTSGPGGREQKDRDRDLDKDRKSGEDSREQETDRESSPQASSGPKAADSEDDSRSGRRGERDEEEEDDESDSAGRRDNEERNDSNAERDAGRKRNND